MTSSAFGLIILYGNNGEKKETTRCFLYVPSLLPMSNNATADEQQRHDVVQSEVSRHRPASGTFDVKASVLRDTARVYCCLESNVVLEVACGT